MYRIKTWMPVEASGYDTKEAAEREKARLEELDPGNIYEVEEVDEKMITKKEIAVVSGLNPDYIEILGQAIAKEGRKDPMDFSYILEKTGKIERFIRNVTEDMRRQEEDEIEVVE